MSHLLLLLLPSAWATTYTVANENDGGTGSLRKAMTLAGAGDTIEFAAAVDHIVLTAALPDISVDDLTIDGAGDVIVDGDGLSGNGFTIDGTDGVSILGLQITGFDGHGVAILGATDTVIGGAGSDENAIYGNVEAGIWVGEDAGSTDSTGTHVAGNRIGLQFDDTIAPNCDNATGDCAGVLITADGPQTTLSDNVISGNETEGVRVHADDVTIEDNIIGLGTSGTSNKRNKSDGILVSGASSVATVDGLVVSGNIVSGNSGNGLTLGAFTSGAEVDLNTFGGDINGDPEGNEGHGVAIAGSDHLIGTNPIGSTTLFGNLMIANEGSGIQVAGEGHTIVNNHVGTLTGDPPVAEANAAYGIRVISGAGGVGDRHLIGRSGEPNYVSGNDLGGIWVDAEATTVSYNVVGLGQNDSTPTGNGADPSSLGGAFGGILVTAIDTAHLTATKVEHNMVSGNDHHGIWVRGDSATVDLSPAIIRSNDIGVDVAGDAVANDGDGILIQAAHDITVDDNLVAGNTGAGIHVLSTSGTSSTGFLIEGNEVGSPDDFGNDTYGIWLQGSGGGLATANGVVDDNEVHHNGDIGIYSSNGATFNEITENVVYDNGACAIRSDDASNGGRPWRWPTVESYAAGTATGAWEDYGVSPIDRIEVYHEDGTFLGSTTVSNGSWSISGLSGVSSVDDVRALAISTQGLTSDLTRVGGDGCEPIDCDVTMSNDNDWCGFYAWDGTQCTWHQRPEGYPCNDGDPTTGKDKFGTADTGVPDQCNASGTCVGGTPLANADDCPFKTACNEAYFDTGGDNICAYRSSCAVSDPASLCGVDDFNTDTGAGCDVCQATACQDLLVDDDGDGIPESWEGTMSTYDWNCDGTPDDELNSVTTQGVHEEHLFVLWMSEDCPNNHDTDTTNDTDDTGILVGVHHHRPSDEWLTKMKDAYGNADKELYVEMKCIPHATQLALADIHNKDPDCDALDDQAYIRRLKARHFAPWRRGIYRFAVMAHGTTERDITGSQQADGECTSTTGGKVGHAEIVGDDIRVADQHAVDRDAYGNFPDADHRDETITLFHEKGHTLGLLHNGGTAGGNDKPNFQSSMNYRYQTLKWWNAASPETIIDYSHVDEHTLSEGALWETGLNVYQTQLPEDDMRRVKWDCPDGADAAVEQPVWPDGRGIDWNCNGMFETSTVSVSIDGDGKTESLAGKAEWTALKPAYCGNGTDFDDLTLSDEPFPEALGAEILEVVVDVVPGTCDDDPVSLDDSAPVIAVLYGSADWSLADLDRRSITLGGGRARRALVDDVDSDGYDDLRLAFRASQLPYVTTGSTWAVFNARLVDGSLLYALPEIEPGTYANYDGDRVVDICDDCPYVAGTGDDGC